jgi:TrmH family RNA methyltransferase
MIESPHNEKLKTIRRLRERKHRDRDCLFVVEGEDLVAAAEAAGIEPEFRLVAGEDVEAGLLAAVSTLGSGTRAIGVYAQRWAEPGGDLSVYLDQVGDPGNVGAIIRAAHALADGPVILGPGCADPHSSKAVRATMGSIFSRPPARAEFAELVGTRIAFDARAETTLSELEPSPPIVICMGGERRGLAGEVLEAADAVARIPIRPDGPDSLNVAVAASVALYELGNRISRHA